MFLDGVVGRQKIGELLQLESVTCQRPSSKATIFPQAMTTERSIDELFSPSRWLALQADHQPFSVLTNAINLPANFR